MIQITGQRYVRRVRKQESNVTLVTKGQRKKGQGKNRVAESRKQRGGGGWGGGGVSVTSIDTIHRIKHTQNGKNSTDIKKKKTYQGGGVRGEHVE